MADTAHILTMDEVAPFITGLAEQIKKGVYESRTKKGVIMELPEEITIQAVIVTKVQHVPISKTSTRNGNETQGGGSSEESVVQESSQTDGQAVEQSTSQSVQKSTVKETNKSEGKSTGQNTQSTLGSTVQDQTSRSQSEETASQSTNQSGRENSSATTDYDYEERG
jgi:hypothetical protein